jgi:hypothetical protein
MDSYYSSTYPVKPGDWLKSKFSGKIGKVKNVYRDGDDVLVDVVLYDGSGARVGRDSPSFGGPRSFEPACNYRDWHRIAKPVFPLHLERGDGSDSEDISLTALPERQWTRPARLPRIARMPRVRNFDPRIEAEARRLAARQLRDIARELGYSELAQRAATLDAEADAIQR